MPHTWSNTQAVLYDPELKQTMFKERAILQLSFIPYGDWPSVAEGPSLTHYRLRERVQPTG